MKRAKNIVINLMLVIISILVAFLLTEAGLKLFGDVERPRLIEKPNSSSTKINELPFLKPHYQATFTSAEYNTEIKLNALGIRDREYDIDKGKEVFRILTVGDSFTFGLGVEAQQPYPKVLERILNAKAPQPGVRYEVINAGGPGLGTFQELMIINYLMKYNPDLILLGLLVENRWNTGNGNDLIDNYKFSYSRNNAGKPITNRSKRDSIKTTSQLIDALNKVQQFLAKYSDLYFLLMTKGGSTIRKYFIKFREDPNREELRVAWEITQNALREVKSVSDKSFVPLIVIRIPFLFDIHYPEIDQTSAILARFSEQSKIPVCDLKEVMVDHRDDRLYYPADGHWTAVAHGLAAEEIYRYLIANDLLKREEI